MDDRTVQRRGVPAPRDNHVSQHTRRRRQGKGCPNDFRACLAVFVACLFLAGAYYGLSASVVEIAGFSPAAVGNGRRPGQRSGRSLTDPYWQGFHNMSIVYTWVNGSDAQFREQRKSSGNGGGESRYRETEELMHSLRCWERFAPWHTGDIIIVSPNGVSPSWLNTSISRIRVVDQYSIIPKEVQPAFNSAVVEQVLHLIPGLTEIFVHMNDDYMIGRLLHPSDFVTDDGGVRLYFEGNVVHGATSQYQNLKSRKSKQWLASVYHTVGIVEDRISRLKTRYFIKHAPFVYSKKAFGFMWVKFEKELNAASRMKFRHYDDVLVPFLHHTMLLELATPTTPFDPKKPADYTAHLAKLQKEPLPTYEAHIGTAEQDAILCIIKDSTQAAYTKMIAHLEKPHMFFTVNDGFKRDESAELLRAFLQRIQPFQASFENPHPARVSVPSPEGGGELLYVARPDVARWSNDYDQLVSRSARAAIDRNSRTLNSELPLAESYATADTIMLLEEAHRQQKMVLWRKGTYSFEEENEDAVMRARDASNNQPPPKSPEVANRNKLLPCGKPDALFFNCKTALSTPRDQISAKKTYETVPSCEAVDVVITWVNGSDPLLISDTARLSQTKADKDKARIRDTQQLRFGLRSVFRHLYWARHIWVVSGTPKPAWLDDTTPYLSFIHHADIFTKEERPQLNSNSIQSRLHLIPNLAMRYVSMDDDYMMLKPIQPEDILGRDSRYTKQSFRGKFKAGRFKKSVYKDAILHSQTLVDNYFAGLPEGTVKPLDSDRPLLDLLHAPVVVDRIAMQGVQAVFKKEVTALNSHKFRQPDDFEPHMGLTFFLQAMKRVKEREVGRGFLGSAAESPKWFSNNDLACRVVGQHPSQWGAAAAKRFAHEVREEDNGPCLSTFNESTSSSCQNRLLDAAAKVALKQYDSPKGDIKFMMLKDTTNFDGAYETIASSNAKFACLNDDFESVCMPILYHTSTQRD